MRNCKNRLSEYGEYIINVINAINVIDNKEYYALYIEMSKITINFIVFDLISSLL